MSVDIREAIERLASFISRLEREKRPPRESSGSRVQYPLNADVVSFSKQDLGGLLLTGDDAKDYRECVDAIYRKVAGKSESISRSAVASFIQAAILKGIDISTGAVERDFSKRLASALVDLKKDLETEPRAWEVHFPVEGLEPQKLPYDFGGCMFCVGDDDTLNDLLRRVNAIAVAVIDSQVDQAVRESAERVSTLVKGRTVAFVRVDAVDEDAARSLARKIVRNRIDVLSFFANLGGQPPSRVIFLDDPRPGILNSLAFSEELGTSTFPCERIGPVAPFSFSAPFLEKAGLNRASELLKKDRRTEFDERIVSALQWAGRASVESRTEEAFLLFAISIESLVMDRDEKSEVTEALALRISHIVGTNPTGKQKIYKEMKGLYRIRSQIVHKGSVEVAEDQLSLIRYFARVAILTMLTDSRFAHILTDSDLVNYFRARMLV